MVWSAGNGRIAVLLVMGVLEGHVVAGQSPSPAPDHGPAKAQMAAELGYSLEYDQGPRPEKLTRPSYPKAALEACIEGRVVLLIGIDADGSVTASKVVESTNGLDEAALDTVKNWRFKPAQKSGEPVGSVELAPVTFSIRVKGQVTDPCKKKSAPASEGPVAPDKP